MFKQIILAFALIMAMVGCDRVGDHGNKNCDLIPRSVLLANPDRFCVSMSNEGDKIAYLSKKGDGIELKIEDFSGKLIRKFNVIQSRGLYVFGIAWAHTGKHILIHQDTNGDENSHVYCLNITTGQSKDLTPFKGAKSVIKKLSPKYPSEILVTSNDRDPKWLDVYRINIISGKAKKIFKNNT
jgi:Tol biopolymer transport system component